MYHRAFSHGEVWIRGTDLSEHEIIAIDEDNTVTTYSPPPARGPNRRDWSAETWNDSLDVVLEEGPSRHQADSTLKVESFHGPIADFMAEFFPPQTPPQAASCR